MPNNAQLGTEGTKGIHPLNPFDDIRPYNDAEVGPAIKGLLADQEFISLISRFWLPNLTRFLPSLARPVTKHRLSKKVKHINSVKQVQTLLERYLADIIRRTTTELTVSGVRDLNPEKTYLFISNHRDIVMDAAMVNYALFHNGFETAEIAIGDNLLQRPFVAALLRLNKCFIVNRSVRGIREKLRAYKNLSSYINHRLKAGRSIWIAQREGRAKDGLDKTDPAIIKMLYMSQKKKGVSFSDHIHSLNVMPVTIAYEYNPCDERLSRELHEWRKKGRYAKASDEDFRSIIAGMNGYKGRVHINFGRVLGEGLSSSEAVAEAIDRQMVENYHLHPSNVIAARKRDPSIQIPETVPEEKEREFMGRLENCHEDLREIILEIYANPALRKLGAQKSYS
jgi:1-acyl-sn-glycerol-3-phosphate acyltransferase